MTDIEENLANLEKNMARLNHNATILQRAERLKALGNEPVKRVWFDNTSCDLFIPDALDDRIQSLVLTFGKFFEEPLLRQAKEYIPEGSVVVDIGANMGNHTMFFAKVCKAARVYSFEPMARLVQIIERNKKLNGFSDGDVTVMNCGCGDKAAKLSMAHHNPGNLGATQFTYDESGDFEVKRLDDIEIDHIDFLKIDAERMGDLVLLGAKETIAKSNPIIWIELYDGEDERARAILSDYGYTHTKALTKHDHFFSKNPL